jgi:hypothetical protein
MMIVVTQYTCNKEYLLKYFKVMSFLLIFFIKFFIDVEDNFDW